MNLINKELISFGLSSSLSLLIYGILRNNQNRLKDLIIYKRELFRSFVFPVDFIFDEKDFEKLKGFL